LIIRKIDLNTEIEQLVAVIRKSFITVADDFNITPDNAPSNPAFINKEALLKSAEKKDINYYGCYEQEIIIGCYALEKAWQQTYYLERLAVVPEKRQQGFGRRLVLDSLRRVKEEGGTNISIAIIDEHEILKNWYKSLGFVESGRKTFDHLPFDVCFLRYMLID